MIAEKAEAVVQEGGVSRIGLEDITGIIGALIQMIMNCRGKDNPTAVHRVLKRFGPVQRARAAQVVKDRLGKANARLVKNIEEVASETTVMETAQLMDEAPQMMADFLASQMES